MEGMDDAFATRLQARLRKKRLENAACAQRIAGPYLRDEIVREIMGPLTRKVVARHGLRDLPPQD
jgi:hypothetical protein